MAKDRPYIIIGGTFDPVHNGHILLATAIHDLLHEDIVFIPAATPNYKAAPTTTASQRLEMLKLAINNNPHFVVDTSEIYLKQYMPTIKSLQLLRQKLGYTRPIYFFIGEDSLISLDTWDSWQNLFNFTNFIVAMRPGYNLEQMPTAVKKEYAKRIVHNTADLVEPNGQIYTLNFTPLDISSTKIRNNIAHGLSIDTMVDPKVVQYIRDNKLYCGDKFC